jgi:hypothetical protein
MKTVGQNFSVIEDNFEFAPFEAIIAPVIQDVLKDKKKINAEKVLY